MRSFLVAMAFFSSIVNLLGGEPVNSPYKVADAYREMRSVVLRLKPADFGQTDDTAVLAVVMDTGLRDAAYTLIATVDGSASLYFTNGGGIIGAGGRPEGDKASKAFVTEAPKYLGKMKATKETPIVSPGLTTFYIVTGKGIFTASAKEEDLSTDRHELSPLFQQAHALITVFRAIDNAHSGKY